MVKLGPKKGLAQFRSESRTARPHHAVSIHNLRTRYGELLALWVYLTWLLHVGLGLETCLAPLLRVKNIKASGQQKNTDMSAPSMDAPTKPKSEGFA